MSSHTVTRQTGIPGRSGLRAKRGHTFDVVKKSRKVDYVDGKECVVEVTVRERFRIVRIDGLLTECEPLPLKEGGR